MIAYHLTPQNYQSPQSQPLRPFHKLSSQQDCQGSVSYLKPGGDRDCCEEQEISDGIISSRVPSHRDDSNGVDPRQLADKQPHPQYQQQYSYQQQQSTFMTPQPGILQLSQNTNSQKFALKSSLNDGYFNSIDKKRKSIPGVAGGIVLPDNRENMNVLEQSSNYQSAAIHLQQQSQEPNTFSTKLSRDQQILQQSQQQQQYDYKYFTPLEKQQLYEQSSASLTSNIKKQQQYLQRPQVQLEDPEQQQQFNTPSEILLSRMSMQDAKRNQQLLETNLVDLPYLKQSDYIQRTLKNPQYQISPSVAVSKAQQDTYSNKLFAQEEILRSKKERLVDEKVRSELSECTFIPRVNEGGARRSKEQFCELQSQFLQYTEQKKIIAREQLEEERMAEVTGKPRILEKSKKLMESKPLSDVPAFARLYYLHKRAPSMEAADKPQQQQQQQQYYRSRLATTNEQNNTDFGFSFTPEISKKSKSLVRSEKVDEILYKDAQRRQAKVNSPQRCSSASNRSLSAQQKRIIFPAIAQNEIILIQKFKREFDGAWAELKVADDGNVNLQQLFQLLQALGFLKAANSPIDQAIQSEDRLVLLLFSLAGGDLFGSLMKSNLFLLLQSVLGLGLNDSNLSGKQDKVSSLPQAMTQMTFVPTNPTQQTVQTNPNVFEYYNSQQFSLQQQQLQKEQQQQWQDIGIAHNAAANMLMDDGNSSNVNLNTQSSAAGGYDNGKLGQQQQQQFTEQSEQQRYSEKYQTVVFNTQQSANLSKKTEGVQFDTQQQQDTKTNNNITEIQPALPAEILPNSGKNAWGIELGSFDTDTHEWRLGNDDRRVIHQAFDVLYRNRLTYEELGVHVKDDQKFTFEPTLDAKSCQLALNQREKVLIQAARMLEANQISMRVPENGKISHQQLLILQKMGQESRTKEKQLARQKLDLQECTFTPKISNYKSKNTPKAASNAENQSNSHNLNNMNSNLVQFGSLGGGDGNSRGSKKSEELFMLSKQTVRKDRADMHLEDAILKEHCTFRPDIPQRKTPKNDRRQLSLGKDAEKNIERLRNAQKAKEEKNLMIQRGYTNSTTNSGSNYNTSNKNTHNANNNEQSELMARNNSRNQDSNTKSTSRISSHAHSSSISNSNTNNNTITARPPIMPGSSAGASSNQKSNATPNSSGRNQGGTELSSGKSTAQFGKQDQDNLMYNNRKQAEKQAEQHSQPTPQPFFSPSESQRNSSNIPESKENVYQQGYQEDYSKTFLRDRQAKTATAEDPVPLLFVDVNLGMGRTERIVVHEGDRSDELAARFAASHNLDENTRDKFKELLDSQIAGLLSRIDEEEMLSQNDSDMAMRDTHNDRRQ